MLRRLFFSGFMFVGLGLAASSCAPGVYVGASVGSPYPYYGPRYYEPHYYAPRPVIVVAPRPYYGGGYHGGGHGYQGGYR